MPYKDRQKRLEYGAQYRAKHREKARKYIQTYYKTDKGRNKIYQNKYGITLEEYNILLEKQLYACAICKEPENQISWGKSKRLSVDHNHKTGKVRGLLCQKCNTTLGRYKDDISVWHNFVTYLESVE